MSSIELSCPRDLYEKTTPKASSGVRFTKNYPFELVILMINFYSGLTNLSRNESTESVRAIMNQHLTRYFQRCLSVKLFLCTKISWNLNQCDYWLVVERFAPHLWRPSQLFVIIYPFWEDIKRIVLISQFWSDDCFTLQRNTYFLWSAKHKWALLSNMSKAKRYNSFWMPVLISYF